MYRFYMVLPALLTVLLDVFLPYGIAFKITAVCGLVAFPAAAWFMGRVARLPYPVPELLAVAAVFFMYDESFTIYGGNIASTMAGEYSFSIALTLALVGFAWCSCAVTGSASGSGSPRSARPSCSPPSGWSRSSAATRS